MKKFSVFLATITWLAITLTGCLKDKDFENEKYGIQVQELKAVAFPLAARSPIMNAITGQPDALTVNGPVIAIEHHLPTPSDLHMTLEFDDALVTAADLEPLPAGTYSINNMEPVIKAGDSTYRLMQVTVTGTDVLDPNKAYGIGIRITSADGGYQLARNQKEIVVGFTIKNKYDGIYRLQGFHNRPNYDFPYDVEMHLVTTGPNEVEFFWPEANSIGHPVGDGPGSVTWYGPAVAPRIVFDPVTNEVTNVYNSDPTGPVITLFTGAGSRLSKFDPVTRAITVDWNYNNNPLRAFFDDLTFISPRP